MGMKGVLAVVVCLVVPPAAGSWDDARMLVPQHLDLHSLVTVGHGLPSNNRSEESLPLPPGKEMKSPPVQTAPSTQDFSLCPEECSGRGRECVAQKHGPWRCVSKAGYGGNACNQWNGCLDLDSCSGRGKCVCGTDRCECNCTTGYTGANCASTAPSACPNHCSGRGKCRPDKGFVCECMDEFTGADCSGVKLGKCVNSCSGQGRCDFNTNQCDCQGSTATDCALVDSTCSACRHGGCDTGDCKCDKAFTGKHCDVYNTTVDPCAALSFCSGRGVCASGGDHGPTCTCTLGFTGTSCGQVEMNKTSCVNSCSGRGTCNTALDKCDCDSGWAGDDCQVPKCPLDSTGKMCSGRGICEDGGTCQCDPCFRGAQCEDNSLTKCPGLCSQHGNCVCSRLNNGTLQATCECASGWEGANCSVQSTDLAEESDCCRDSCSGNGDCNNCTCLCFPDWTGPACNQRVDSSAAFDTDVPTADEDALEIIDLLQASEGSAKTAAPATITQVATKGLNVMAELWN